MATRLTSSGITFPDNTVQTTAASSGPAGFSGATINPVSATSLTLTADSNQCQIVQFSSASNSIVKLPSTASPLGAPFFRIINNSQCNSPVTVVDSAGVTIAVIPLFGVADITLVGPGNPSGPIWSFSMLEQESTPVRMLSATMDLDSVGLTTSNEYICATQLSDTLTVLAAPQATSGTVKVVACAASGTGFTFSSVVTIPAPVVLSSLSTDSGIDIVRLSSTTAVLAFRVAGTNGSLYANLFSCAVISVPGVNVVTYGSWNTMNTPGTNVLTSKYASFSLGPKVARVSDTSFAVVYQTLADSSIISPFSYGQGYGSLSCTVGSVSGLTITAGSAVALSSNDGNPMALFAILDNNLAMSFWTRGTSAKVGKRKVVPIQVSGTVPTFRSVVTIDSADVTIFTPQTKNQHWMYGGSTVGNSGTNAILALPYSQGGIPKYIYCLFSYISGTLALGQNQGGPIDLTPDPTDLLYAPVFLRRSASFISCGISSYNGAVGGNGITYISGPTWYRIKYSSTGILYMSEKIRLVSTGQRSWPVQGFAVPDYTGFSTTAFGFWAKAGSASNIYSATLTVPS